MEALQEEYSDRVWEKKYELQDFLKHDELYEAYPMLRHTTLRFEKLDPGVKGKFDKRNGAIILSDSLFGKWPKTLLHEILHTDVVIDRFYPVVRHHVRHRILHTALRQQRPIPSEVGHFVLPLLCGHLPAAGRFSRLDLSCRIDVLPQIDLAGVFHLPFQIEQLPKPLLRIELFIESVVLRVQSVVFLRVSRLFGVEKPLQLPVDLLGAARL